MLCPECNATLSPIQLTTATGNVVLDYCATCGGIWSDQGEINFVKLKDLGPLSRLLPQKPQHPTIQYHLCPKDRNTLELFKGESVPADISIFRCQVCGGIFFPEGTLPNFKHAQESKINYFKSWKIPLHSVYAILLPLLLILVLGGGLLATIVSVQRGTDIRSKAKEAVSKPLVLSPAASEILISFTTITPSITKIKYWIKPDVVTEAWVSPAPDTVHTVRLKYLEENQSYSYQLIVTEPNPYESPVYLFTTKSGN